MKFAREVKNVRSVIKVSVEGNAAWITTISRSTGSFHGRQINSSGTELMVLTKSSHGWQIRAIHWSSHDATKTK
jgi:ketosteroid isomerase-like protein